MSAAANGRTELRLEGLCVPRGEREVVHDVSLTIPPGEVTTLLGATARASRPWCSPSPACSVPPPARCCWASRTSRGAGPSGFAQAGVAVVPEGRRLLPELTVEDNLRVATYSLSREQRRDGIAYAVELFPELEKRWQTAGRLLSGGEQQMLVLAQALVSRPGTLLIDELSLGLAPVVVKRLVPTIEAVAPRASACC